MQAIDILNNFKENKFKGFQVSKRKGFLSSTWLIYQKDNFIYFFDIAEKIEFSDNYKYTKDEFLQEFKNSHFEIDCEIV
ncbi:hypothetical protein VP395_07400 [Mariniflexile soesokkakense]|uniref:KTSC domain-containing protein n=1 Tax=Mariniflexile soesokkakense TaxID=1343160 RepID=A0ABV0A8Y7_9FLAO